MAEAEEQFDPALIEPPPGTPPAVGPIEQPAPSAPQTPESLRQRAEELYQAEKESIDRRVELSKERQKEMAPIYQGAIQGIEEEIARRPTPPQPVQLPPMPRREDFIDRTQANLMKAVGSIMIAVNVGGSRIRGTRAMNAMAGSIDGFIAGNTQRAAEALQDYDRQVKDQIAQYNMMSEWYRNMLSTSKENIQNRMLQVQLKAKQWDDPIADEIARGGDIAKLLGHADSVAARAEMLQHSNEQLKLQEMAANLHERQFQETIRHHKTTEGIQAGGGGPGGAAGDLGDVDANTMAIVKAIANYQIPLPTGFALRSPYWQRIMGLVQQYDSTFDASQYQARMATRKSFYAGKDKDNIVSLNTLTGHLETLKKAADKLDNVGGFPLAQQVNAAKNAVLTSQGNSAPTNFEVAAEAVASELARVFKGTGATDQEIKAWRATISSSQTPEQLHTNIDKAIELMGSRIEALADRWEKGMGKPKDFSILSDKSRQILKAIGYDPTKIEPQAKAQAAGGIRVKRKSDGKMGTIPEGEFDPNLYERVQ